MEEEWRQSGGGVEGEWRESGGRVKGKEGKGVERRERRSKK